MAQTFGLNKIKDTMTSVWGYGDILFAKEINEINFTHNNLYPLCVVIEPNSVMPSIYEGWENYSYEVYFCMRWHKVNRAVGPRDQKLDNIQDMGNEWLDFVLRTYNKEDLILEDESLTIERIKTLGNDKVIAVKFTFTLQGFRQCFNPKTENVDSLLPSNPFNLPYEGTMVWQGTGTNAYTYDMKCTGWWKFRGWKETTMIDTVRYVTMLKDMRAYPMSGAGYQNFTRNWYNKNYFTNPADLHNTAILKSDSPGGGEALHGYTTGGNIPIATDLTKYQFANYYNGWDLLAPWTANEGQILNGSEWSLTFVFEMGASAQELDNTYLFHQPGFGLVETAVGSGQFANFNAIAIYFDANSNLIIDITDHAGVVHTTSYNVTVLFGWDVYTREDRVVTLCIDFLSPLLTVTSAPNYQFTTLVMLTPTGGAAGTLFWGKNKNLLLCESENTAYNDYKQGYRRNFYEMVSYNYPTSLFFFKNSPNLSQPNQSKWITQKLYDEYNLTYTN